MAKSSKDYVLVAAIDFGTTFSGYAFSFKSTKSKPDLAENIRINKSWGATLGFQSYKNPTSVLTNRAGEFLAFGFDAERKYGEALEEDDEDPDMLMFRHFKMMLHKRENVREGAVIASLDGTIHPALEIFSHAIRFLKEHLLNAIKTETGAMPNKDMLRWVLTVPAIWVDESKQFMRKAAFMAGCMKKEDSENLIIALEPEAASLCCRRLSIAQYEHVKEVKFPAGTKYLVLDCGGGTIDITMHVMKTGDTVKEVLRASGGPWGGTEVDANFVRLMGTVLGKNFLNEYKHRHPNEWLQFLTSFERAKKSLQPTGNDKISLTLPYTMGILFAELNKGKRIDKHLKESASTGVSFRNGMIVIQRETAISLFLPVVESIVEHTKKLLRDPKARNLSFILMVGGFSECQLLQEEIKKNFENGGLKVLIPGEAQLAIIKGAVLYGHRPNEISSRIARYSYGDLSYYDFDPKIHNVKYKEKIDGKMKCGSIFDCYIVQGDEIDAGFKKTLTANPIESKQQTMTFEFYAKNGKPNKPVQYVDGEGMRKVGKVRVQLTGRGIDRDVQLTMTFGGTEVHAEAIELASGNRAKTTIDFLHESTVDPR